MIKEKTRKGWLKGITEHMQENKPGTLGELGTRLRIQCLIICRITDTSKIYKYNFSITLQRSK